MYIPYQQIFYVCYLLVLVFIYFSLLALRSQNQQTDGLQVCYKQLGYSIILISPDCIRCLIPLFWGRQGNAPNFVKNWMVPSFADLS